MERQTFRAARIVNNLLEFARKRPSERGPVDVAALITETLDLLADRFAKRRIEIDWRPTFNSDEGPVVIDGCDGELQQIFTNLFLNALDAMSPRGRGRLEVRRQRCQLSRKRVPVGREKLRRSRAESCQRLPGRAVLGIERMPRASGSRSFAIALNRLPALAFTRSILRRIPAGDLASPGAPDYGVRRYAV
jgi:hypothetical protein